MGGPIQRLPLATVIAALLALPPLSGCTTLRRTLAPDPWIARLQPAISRALGHPVHLGPLRRTVPGGLVLGPSRIDPRPGDGSRATIGELELRPDPLASLSRRQLVATLVLRQVQLDLRRNSSGQYWIFPPAGHGEPPPLDLTLVVADGARLQVDPGGPWQVNRLRGRLHLPQRRLELQGNLRPGSAAAGELDLALRMGLRPHGPLQLGLTPRALPLAPLAALWPDGPLQTLRGRAWGAVQLDRRAGGWQARGPLRLEQLQAGRRGWGPELRSPLLQVLLDGNRVLTAPADLQWGPWRGRGAARVLLRPPGGGTLVELVGRLAPRGRIPALAAWVQLHHRRDHWQVPRLDVRSGRSSLLAEGQLTPTLALRTRSLRLDPQLWTPPGRPVGAPVEAQLRLAGDRWLADLPQLSLATPVGPLGLAGVASGHWRGEGERLQTLEGRWTLPAGVPWRGQRLLGPLAGQLRWWQGRLWLRGGGAGPSPDPVALDGWWQPPAAGAPTRGPVALEARLGRFPLQRLEPSLPLRGALAGSARLGGSLAQPRLTARLSLHEPGLGPLQWPQVWRGGWSDGRLSLATDRGQRLTIAVGRQGLGDLLLQQGDGRLALQRRPGGWRWQARDLPLAPLQLMTQGRAPLALRGLLDGEGAVALAPFVLDGRARLRQPRLDRLQVRSLAVQGRLQAQGYRLALRLALPLPGEVEGRLEGRWSGPLDLTLQVRRLQIASIGNLWQGLRGGGPAPGTARDLLGLMTDTLGRSLDEQLQALAQARAIAARAEQRRRGRQQRDLDDLRGLLDAELRLRGPRPDALNLEAQARAHLWHEGEDRDRVLQLQPLTLSVDGPLGGGEGMFGFAGLPLGLLALLTPVPDGLRGSLQGQGRWRSGPGPLDLQAELALADASLRERPLRLERGQLRLNGSRLAVDLALRSEGASSSVDLSGQVPLDARADGLELRLASRNDGLLFLTALAGGELDWQAGSADLQLLVRGRRERPLANGFLRIRDGRLLLAGQPFRDVQATAFFDFERLQLEQLTASLGERGQVEGQGSLPLWAAAAAVPGSGDAGPPSLRLRLDALPLRRDTLRLQADGTLEVAGSLQAPRVGGDLRLSRGRLLLPASRLQGPGGKAPAEAGRHPESAWDGKEPLVLLGPSVESSSGLALRRAIPSLALLSFDGLRLNLGPDLRLTVPPVLDFSTGGRLQLDGPFGPDVRLSGVVRLLKGQINVFTSFLRLDPDSPNVAVFTPSLGLIPYLDLALTTRVSDQVRSIDGAALPTDRLQGAFSSLDRLNLVKVNVRVSGPADRIGENIVIRSSPPLPRERLVALLGGNTLAGLSGGDAGTALVTVLGQTLLTPVVGGLTELLGQRLNVALYPTYLDPTLLRGATNQDGQARGVRPSSRRVPLQLVLGSEVGLDITDRLNLSVLAAPNRSDIPPEATLRFQASDLLGVQGSVDQEGRWQTQLQMFFRF